MHVKTILNRIHRHGSFVYPIWGMAVYFVYAMRRKEDFQGFWEYVSPAWAGKFLDRWCTRTMRSKIQPMKRVARMLRTHRELLLNWFRARGTVSAAVVEGLNNKLKLTLKKAYGFRTFQAAEIGLYHHTWRPS